MTRPEFMLHCLARGWGRTRGLIDGISRFVIVLLILGFVVAPPIVLVPSRAARAWFCIVVLIVGVTAVFAEGAYWVFRDIEMGTAGVNVVAGTATIVALVRPVGASTLR